MGCLNVLGTQVVQGSLSVVKSKQAHQIQVNGGSIELFKFTAHIDVFEGGRKDGNKRLKSPHL